MKKLLIAMTAVSALSVFAENPFSATAENFESQEVGPFLISDVSGADYWAMADYDAAADDVGEVKEEDSNKFLAVETSSKTLYRTLKEVNEQEIVDTAEIGDGLVFDARVKFTCRDTLDVPPLDDGAKIAIWAGYDGDEEEPSTNLYITAAAVSDGYELSSANFLLDADIDFTAWHRVTIRADRGVSADEDNEKLIGFKVWIDEEQVVADETDYAGKIDASVLSDSAKKDLASRQLFIGLAKDLGDAGLAALGFNGQGSVDNIGAFDNDNAPAFTKPAVGFEAKWDTAAIASLSINGEVIDVSLGKFDVKEAEVTAIVGFKAGYFGDAEQTLNAKNTDIVAHKLNFTVDGKNFETLEEAIAAASESGKTLTLAQNYVQTKEIDLENGENLVFDLAGNTLTEAIDDAEGCVFYLKNSALTVIDSVGGGAIKAGAESVIPSLFYNEGTLAIGAAEGDMGATFVGVLGDGDEFVIYKGKFDVANNTDEEVAAFLFGQYVVDGGKVEQVDDFWAVNMGDEPEPQTITISIATADDDSISAVYYDEEDVADDDLELPAGTTQVTLTLEANEELTIPVFKVVRDNETNVTAKVATYTIVDGDTLLFFAEEAEEDDPDVTDDQVKKAIIDAIDEPDWTDEADVERYLAASNKVEAVVGEGAVQVSAKKFAAYITDNSVTSEALANCDYVAASVKLGTDDLINEDTEVEIAELVVAEGGALTFEVNIDGEQVDVEAIKDMVEASSDLSDWAKNKLEITAAFDEATSTVTVTPKDATDKAFMKVVIPKDPEGK